MFPLIEQINETKMQEGSNCLYTNVENLTSLWHERYGHLSNASIETIQRKGMVEGLPKFKVEKGVCTECPGGKQHRKPIPKKSTWRAKEVLELIHSDICRLVNCLSNSGKGIYYVSSMIIAERDGFICS